MNYRLYRNQNRNLTSGAAGVQDLYLVFTGGSGFLFNVNWWRFSTTRAAAAADPATPAEE